MVSQVIAISLLILGYELGELRVTGTVALWAVMIFALASGIDYFVAFRRRRIGEPVAVRAGRPAGREAQARRAAP